MSEPFPLFPYVPTRLLTSIEADPAPHPDSPWEERMDGAVMFVDVSGFSALSESLAAVGSKGTERLTSILNHFYRGLVAGVEDAGGFVARFNGDAITAILPDADPTEALRQAVACGLELIRVAFARPPEVINGVDFPLRLKVGVDAGSIYTAAVGDQDGELRYLVAGGPVQGASRASAHCQPMELLLPRTWADALPSDVRGLPVSADHLRVIPTVFRNPSSAVPVALDRPPVQTTAPRERLARFVPEAVDERLKLGPSGLLAEHRSVAVLFASFEGISFEVEEGGRIAQIFASAVFKLVKQYGGTVDKLEQSDKGNLIMALFGAPRALERPEEAALSCALVLRERYSGTEGPRVTRVGVNSGMVFAGNVGAPWRHDYTVMGHEVNLASRLTSVARAGEILIPAKVRGRLADWQFGPPRVLRLKGQRLAVEVWPVLSGPAADMVHDPDVIELPDRGTLLLGRELERAQLDAALARLKQGDPAVVLLVGETGIGKSTLARYVAERGFEFARVIYQRHRRTGAAPYSVWQWPVLDLLGGPGQDLRRRAGRVFSELDSSAGPWLSLFNPLLGLDFPITSLVRTADPRAREQKLRELVGGLVLRVARDTPLLLVLEDFSESDSASQTLLRHLASVVTEAKAPVMMLVIGRPDAPSLSLAPDVRFERIPLSPLKKEELADLLETELGMKLSRRLLEEVWVRSQGNPLFAIELAHTLELVPEDPTEGGPEGGSGGVLEAAPGVGTQLPDTLRALFQSRIDSLTEAGRVVAKVAAVIGNRVTIEQLSAAFQEDVAHDFVRGELAGLVEARIIHESLEDGQTSYEFRQPMLREVIYDTLTERQQTDLHLRVGRWLEAHDPMARPGVLAHHFELGQMHEKAVQYYLKAGAQAFDAFANEEALSSYQHAITLADAHFIQLPEAQSRSTILEALGDVYFRIGDYRQAERLFRQVRDIAPRWMDVARAIRKEGESRCRHDDIARAMQCVREALLLLKGQSGWSIWEVAVPLLYRGMRDGLLGPPNRAGTPLPPKERARSVELDHVHSVQALVLYYQGNIRVVEGAFRMIETALSLGEPGRIARAYATISFMYASLGMFRSSQKYARAAGDWLLKETDVAARVELRGTITFALIGAAYRLAGQWSRAEMALRQCVKVNQTTGDVWEEGLGHINLAMMWRQRGYLHRAHAIHEALIAWGDRGHPHLYYWEAWLCDGLCLAELGRFEEAEACFDRAFSHPTLNPLARLRALAYRGWMKYLAGRLRGALSDFDQVVQMISDLKMVGEHVAEALLMRVEVLIQSGQRGVVLWWALQRSWLACRKLPAMRGTWALARGLAAVKGGRKRVAMRHFRRAVVLNKRMDRGREAARALVWLAELDQRHGAGLKAEARKLLRDRDLSVLPGGPDPSL